MTAYVNGNTCPSRLLSGSTLSHLMHVQAARLNVNLEACRSTFAGRCAALEPGSSAAYELAHEGFGPNFIYNSPQIEHLLHSVDKFTDEAIGGLIEVISRALLWC